MSDQTGPKKDFVIKLCIVGVQGSPQIRRVRLSSITVDGDISYPALVNVAIKYTFPDDSLEAEHYTVLLTYYDVDNDCITIASTEELIDAIEQFTTAESKALCLRITTDVKKKSPQIPDFGAQPDSPTHESKKSTKKSTGPVELQNVVESFVSILANAVDHLQTQVSENIATSEAKNNVSPTRGTRGKARTSSNSNKANLDANNKASTEEKSKVSAATKPSSDDKVNGEGSSEKKEKPKEEKRPFIHNRHTCDGCLCTPITGDRYHSTNLPDYDLCTKCRKNYKGDEIQFEIVELARDRRLQERWHRRRMNSIGRPGSCRQAYRGRGLRSYGRPDSDLKEAIRRSLQDEATKQSEDLKQSGNETPPPLSDEDDTAKNGQEPAESTGKTPGSGQDEEEPALEQNEDGINPVEVPNTVKGDVVLSSSVTDTELSFPSDTGKSEDNPTAVNSLEESGETDDVENNDDKDDNKSVEEDDANNQEGKDTLIIDSEENSDDKQSEVPTQPDNEKPSSLPDEDDTAQNDQEPAESMNVSENGWQLIPDEDHDEMIARAAQLLGSALFENDLHKSDNMSASNMSLPSSLPSLASAPEAKISPIVLDKWAIHLNQLHEIGFYEDEKSVEILERLTAANIGVDSEDEVSVTQVVNELLKK